MYLKQIMNEVKKHMVVNNIEIENAAINFPTNPNGGELINMSDIEKLKWKMIGREGKLDYRSWEPIIDFDNDGRKICTYVIYSPLYHSR